MRKINDLLKSRAGFTLIELMIVIVVLGILAGIAIPKLSSIRSRADVTAVKSEFKNLQTALEMYRTDQSNGQYPDTLNTLQSEGYIDLDGIQDPDGTQYGYAVSTNSKRYALEYTIIDEDGNEYSLLLRSDTGLTTTSTVDITTGYSF